MTDTLDEQVGHAQFPERGPGSLIRRVRRALEPWMDEPARQRARESLQDCERAAQACDRALQEMSPATRVAGEQRTALEAALEGLEALAGSTRELLAASQRARESLERSRIVALNAGLDGTRLAGPAGKAVVAIAEDLRTHVSRAADALDDHLRLFGGAEQLERALRDRLGEGQRHAVAVAEALERTAEAQHQAARALSSMGSRLAEAAGVDPDVDRELGELAAHATALVDGLGRVIGMPWRRRALQNLLGPALTRLADALRAFERLSETPPP